MEKEEIYNNICVYDKRYPDFKALTELMTKEEIEDARKDCYCDNCFYGRNELALEIIKLKESEVQQ